MMESDETPPKTGDLSLRIECYAGHRGEETPQRFHLGRRTLEIVEVLDRWLAPEHRYFKVRAEDGGVYILQHSVADDRWELTMFIAGRPPE